MHRIYNNARIRISRQCMHWLQLPVIPDGSTIRSLLPAPVESRLVNLLKRLEWHRSLIAIRLELVSGASQASFASMAEQLALCKGLELGFRRCVLLTRAYTPNTS
jgi:hypothetical protein